MANGGAQLDAMIRRVRAIPKLAKEAAPGVARALKQDIDANISAGRAPDGSAWKAKQDGDKPLQKASAHVEVTAVDSVVIATLRGPEVRHNNGTARGRILRQILPTRKIPDSVVRAIDRMLTQRFGRIVGGAK